MWKLTSFGVDMFFSNSCKSKNGENWLVLVLTCFSQTPGIQKMVENWLVLVLTCFSQTPGIQKWWKLTSFGVDMFFSNSWNGENWLVLVLTCFFKLASQTLGKLTSFGVDMFFSNSWNQVFLKLVLETPSKNGENWLVLVLTCFSQTFGVLFFGVDIKLLESKNVENWLVLVLTCFFSNWLVLCLSFLKLVESKMVENWLVLGSCWHVFD